MSSPLPAFDNFDQTATSLDWESDNVILLKQGGYPQIDGIKPTALNTAIGSFKNIDVSRDNKLFDYLLLGVLSILIHNSVIDHFKGASLSQEIVPIAKPENKVQITLYRPQPKPIVPPPQVQAKPPVPKVVPLKPQKPKPQPKIVEQLPEPVPGPVVDSAPVSSGPVSNAPPVIQEKITPPKGGAGYLNNPYPEYPEIAINRGWEGKVVLNIHVGADGKPITANVLKSSGHKELDDSALKIIKIWTFTPAKRGDTPTDGWVTVPINFAI